MTPTSLLPGGVTLRSATDDDWPEFFVHHLRAFQQIDALSDDDLATVRRQVRDGDLIIVRDPAISCGPAGSSDRVVGASSFYRMALTVPGGRIVDVPGLSDVSVAATHRRRGIMRGMMSEMFCRWQSEGFPFAMLNAVEATIYGRFGFGPATFATRVEITTRKAAMRTPAPDPGVAPSTWFGTPDEVRTHLPEQYTRWATAHPGVVHRSGELWSMILADRPFMRTSGASAAQYLLHADGYLTFRFQAGDDGKRVFVDEVVTSTPEAHTELWRTLLATDLVSTVRVLLSADDPLQAKLVDMRAAEPAGSTDMLWLRILDVPAALEMRSYRGDLNEVIEVDDEFGGRGGTFAIRIRGGRASVTASSASPSIRLGVAELSSLYLGGVRATTLGVAGRIWTNSPETLDALDIAFSTSVAPFSGTSF